MTDILPPVHPGEILREEFLAPLNMSAGRPIRQGGSGDSVMENIKPIRTEEDYDWALVEIERYFLDQPEPGTPEGDRFEVLGSLTEAYEAKHWPIEPPDPVEAISYVMAARSLKQSDLAQVIGSRSRASEILNRKRPLTMRMVHQLHQAWHIPAEVLIRPYHVEERG